MALLLDTHAAIWWWFNSPKLSSRAREAIAAASESIFVSAVTTVEIAIKFRIGKLPDFGDPAVVYSKLMAQDRFADLDVTPIHALRAGLLPGEHRDPFDRLIAAQAHENGLTIVTRNPAFFAFGCKVLW